MVVLLSIVVVLICINISNVSCVNYCGVKICQHPNSHTLCKYTPGLGPGCTGFIDAALSAGEKARILVRINKRRSDAAAGLLRNLPPAADMLKLIWVEELAREAQLWADQCSPIQTPEKNDECRDLYATTVGQCIASVIGDAPGLKPASLVDVWYLQSLKFNWNATRDPLSDNSYEYADFAQMLWAKVYMVGCGRTRFMSQWRGHLRSVERLVCNFAPRGPPPGTALWIPGAPASACPEHSAYDRDLPSLCSYRSSFVNPHHTRANDGSIKEKDILLKTLLEIERNSILDYMGSLDEYYLTKLAIATIAPAHYAPLSTSYYGYLEKRNLRESIGLPHNVIDADYNQTNEDFNVHTKGSSTLGFGSNVTATLSETGGKPKSYDIDELSDVGNETVTENSRRSRREREETQVTVDKDIYKDYYNDISRKDLNHVPDLRQTNIGCVESLPDESVMEGVERFHQPNYNTTETASEHAQTSYSELSKDVENSHVTQDPFVVTTNDAPTRRPINISVLLSQPFNQTEEEYLSDPETLRQIQVALDRMDNELSKSMNESKLPPLPVLPPVSPLLPPLSLPPQGIVRVHLRDTASETLDSDNPEPEEPNNSYEDRVPRSTAEILKKHNNNITDEGPIYRTMQHYVPYFNIYRNSFTGDSNSLTRSRSLAPLSLLVILALTF